jgi:hypothetical protein
MANEPMKLLAVRLPEAERRRIKSLAASLGLSLQDAVQQALEMWASQLPPESAPAAGAQVHRAGAGSKKPRRQKPRR